jgi:hypothetical protein
MYLGRTIAALTKFAHANLSALRTSYYSSGESSVVLIRRVRFVSLAGAAYPAPSGQNNIDLSESCLLQPE